MLANVYLKVEDSVLSSPEVAEHSMEESKPRKDRGTIVCTTIDHNRRVVFFFCFYLISHILLFIMLLMCNFFLPVTCFQMKSDINTDASFLPALHLILC